MPVEEWRRIRGEQDIVVRFDPGRAISTLGALLPAAADRVRLAKLLDQIDKDVHAQGASPTAEQRDTLAQIRRAIAPEPARLRRPARRRAKASR
jgi:hypothetical protein